MNMDYPLEEKIGPPELLVGRTKFFEDFHHWIAGIPDKMSKSRVILARRKSGKTVFVQRLFNQLWSANGQVIPLYIEISDKKKWYPHFAMEYFTTFASQYISFLERDPALVRKPLTLSQIAEYGQATGHRYLAMDAQTMIDYEQLRRHDLMWKLACFSPHQYASALQIRFLVILDEFQYLTNTIYPDQHYESNPDDTIPASFHDLAESKVAPLLVTGSYIRWLMKISDRFLEAGRLTQKYLDPFLTPEEGLEAVYAYANRRKISITPETAVQINEASQSDPFVIACVMQSSSPTVDLSTTEGVAETVTYELTNPRSELFQTWATYIHRALDAINDRYAKQIVLFLSKYHDRAWSPTDLKTQLNLDPSEDEIHRKLLVMVEADLIEQTSVDLYFQGVRDGTLAIILRHRFEHEITHFQPNIQQEIEERIIALTKDRNRWRGKVNYMMGHYTEYFLAMELRSRKRFRVSVFFSGGPPDDPTVTITDVQQRVIIQRPDGKNLELDVVAQSSCGRVILVEVKKRQQRMGVQAINDFLEKVQIYTAQHPDARIIPAYLSLGGFTQDALAACEEYGIGYAERVAWEGETTFSQDDDADVDSHSE